MFSSRWAVIHGGHDAENLDTKASFVAILKSNSLHSAPLPHRSTLDLHKFSDPLTPLQGALSKPGH